MNAASHDSLNQGSNILVLNSALATKINISEPAAIAAKSHALVLQIALASLVANRTIQRMINQQELHDTLPGLASQVRVGLDPPALHDRHRAGGDWLQLLLDLHQAHPAVPSDCQPLVVAEPGDLYPDLGRRLENRRSRRNLHWLVVDEQLHQFLLLAQAAC